MSVAKDHTNIQTNVSRRSLMAGALGAAAVTGTPAALALPAKDLHPAWWAEWQRLTAFMDDPDTGEGPDVDAAIERKFEIDGLMANTQATTREGIIAQMEWLIQDGQDYWGCQLHDAVARNVVNALREAA